MSSQQAPGPAGSNTPEGETTRVGGGSVGQVDKAPRLTKRGAATRARIVKAAAELIRTQGAWRTTLDEVIAVSAVSKSQLYRHFENKSALVRAVIDLIGEETMQVERERLGTVDSLEGLRRWRDAVVAADTTRQGRHGCLLGTLAVDVSEEDPLACEKLDAVFQAWRALFETILNRFRDRGLIPTDANVLQIATGFIVAVQGGYLLARMAGNIEPLGAAIDLSIEHLHLLAHVNVTAGGFPTARASRCDA
jgi:AcrR family transcriptional regulator